MIMQSTTLILGANGGIGSCSVKQLVAKGEHVHLLGRNQNALEELATTYAMPYVVVDPTDAGSVSQAFTSIASSYQIKSVVNCVGSILLRPIHLMSTKDWSDTIHTNLGSAFACVQASIKVMLPQNSGNIVLFSTAACEIGLANHEAISAAKAGVVGLMKSAAATYAHNRIQINCIAPGMVETPSSARILANPKAREVSIRAHPLGKIGVPEDVVSLLLWLLDNSWATGQVYTVDGGLSSIKDVR